MNPVNTIQFLLRPSGDVPFQKWFEKLKDRKAKAIIASRLERFESGNPGSCRDLGDGVWEMKIDFGPGYRIYFARSGVTVYLILLGGDKNTQDSDIGTAKKYWKEFKQGLEKGEDNGATNNQS